MKKTVCVLCLVLALALVPTALADGVVNVFNWGDYICPDVLEMFKQETGIEVKYINFTQNEDMMIMVRANENSFDVVFPSDYSVERFIAEGLLAEINFDNIPNFKSVDERFVNPEYDPENKYSVPYMWGTLGILYNTKMVDEPIDSWSVLFDQKYAGQVMMWDSIRDTFGLALRYLGYSVNERDPLILTKAAQLLIKQKQDGIVKAYGGDEMKDKMVAGEAAMAVQYSGDAQYAIDLNPDLAYVVPKEGSNVWADAMVIPKNAPNKENAEKFINFMCRPDVAQLNCEYIWYSTTNKDAVALIGEDYTDNEVMNPPQETIDRCETFRDNYESRVFFDTLWKQVTGAK